LDLPKDAAVFDLEEATVKEERRTPAVIPVESDVESGVVAVVEVGAN
jgi:hypothetical protein